MEPIKMMIKVDGSCMKRLLSSLVVIIVSLLSNSSNAQISQVFKSIDKVDLQVGPGFVTLFNENVTKFIRESKIGYSANIGLIHLFNEKISLNTNFSYARKGVRAKYQVSYYDPTIDINNCKCTTSVGTIESNSNIDYLIFSPLIRINLKQEFLYFETGPFISYLLKSNGYTKNLWDGSINYSNTNNIKDFDSGISLSIGYQFIISDNVYLNVKIIDSYGLLNIVKTSSSDVFTKTNSIYLLAGITFK